MGDAHNELFAQIILFVAQAGFARDVLPASGVARAVYNDVDTWELLVRVRRDDDDDDDDVSLSTYYRFEVDDVHLVTALESAVAASSVGRTLWLLARGATAVGRALHIACAAGRADLVGALLDGGVDMDAADDHGRSPLFVALESGHPGLALTLLSRGASPSPVDDDDATSEGSGEGGDDEERRLRSRPPTPLQTACHRGYLRVAHKLLRRGADPRITHGHLPAPLVTAIKGGHESLAKELLVRNAFDPDGVDEEEEWEDGSLLQIACKRGLQAVAFELLRRGADPAAERGPLESPLVLALRGRHEALALELLRAGAYDEINEDHERFAYQLHTASRHGMTAAALDLIERGALVYFYDDSCMTPFDHAMEGGHEGLALQLLERDKYHFLIEDARGQAFTILHRAAKHGLTGVVLDLLDRGLDVDGGCAEWEGEEGSPLLQAIDGGHEALARLLLDHRASVELAHKSGRSPLHAAIERGMAGVAHRLLDGYPRVGHLSPRDMQPINQRDARKRTPLMLALQHREESLALRLIGMGAAAKRPADERGWRALHYAAYNDQLAAVERLLEKGANPAATNADGRTARELAAAAGHDDVAALLAEREEEEEEENK